MADENILSNFYDKDSASAPYITTNHTWDLSFPKYCDQLIFEINFGGENSGLTFMCDQEPDHLGECTFEMNIGDTKISFERDNSEIPDDDDEFEELEEIDLLLDEYPDDEDLNDLELFEGEIDDDDFELLDEDGEDDD
jgi:hypothetical protein